MTARTTIGKSRRWVVKIGSALLTKEGQVLDQVAIGIWVDQLAELRKRVEKLYWYLPGL